MIRKILFYCFAIVVAIEIPAATRVAAGEILIYESAGKETCIYLLSFDGKGLNKIAEGYFPQWSPNKKMISFVSKTKDWEYRLFFKRPDGSVLPPAEGISLPGAIIRYRWDPKGKGIDFMCYMGSDPSDKHICNIYHYDFDSNKVEILSKVAFENSINLILGAVFEVSPDGSLIILCPVDFSKKPDAPLLIDVKQKRSRNLKGLGYLMRFIGNDKVISFTGSQLWEIHLNSLLKNKLFDLEYQIMSLSNVANQRVIIQAANMNKKSFDLSPKLYLLNIGSNRLEEIKIASHALFGPILSPDGDKFIAIGQEIQKETDPDLKDLNYYVYHFREKKISFLRKYNYYTMDYPLSALLGIGEYASWK